MHSPPLLPPVAVGRADHRVMRAEELVLPLAWTAQEGWPWATGCGCSNPEGKNQEEQALPLVCREVQGCRVDALPASPCHLSSQMRVRNVGWLLRHESGRPRPAPSLTRALQRMDPAPCTSNSVELLLMAKAWVSQPQELALPRHRLQHWREWALCLDWAVQWSWLWRRGCG